MFAFDFLRKLKIQERNFIIKYSEIEINKIENFLEINKWKYYFWITLIVQWDLKKIKALFICIKETFSDL